MATITVLDPTAEPNPVRVPLAERPDTLEGKRLGLLNNSKPNVTLLFETLEECLRERYNLAGVVRRIKPSSGIPTETSVLDELARECDVAVVAIGD